MNNFITKNWIGALVGAIIVYLVPTLVGVSFHIIGIPSNIMGSLNMLLSLGLGALIGAGIQAIFNR